MNGFKPEVLNIGGGFPAQIIGSEPSIEEIGRSMNHAIRFLPPTIQVLAEPGRFLVGSAGRDSNPSCGFRHSFGISMEIS